MGFEIPEEDIERIIQNLHDLGYLVEFKIDSHTSAMDDFISFRPQFIAQDVLAKLISFKPAVPHTGILKVRDLVSSFFTTYTLIDVLLEESLCFIQESKNSNH